MIPYIRGIKCERDVELAQWVRAFRHEPPRVSFDDYLKFNFALVIEKEIVEIP